jgi:hypothetical protein
MNHASIELLTEFVPTPTLHAACSHDCGNFVRMACPPTDIMPLEASLQNFLMQVRNAGWNIGLMGNACPAHVKKMQDAQPRVIAPSNGNLILKPH